ncbi:MAG: bifunctional 4-hydroxy-3-methylbut-2-enyl diphosphate reductase/30S ribosomal protein S1 [Defluviitaleaceae bacterium]|nr:bifunctional 4-hydroxy-3-methylbut-2-enyl diphosphate reductase/30S ribosomal protein S1 [Defluviitaleaceae bacterium]
MAGSAGFCAGVARAVEKVSLELDKGARVATYGPLIHNGTVTGDLSRRGAKIIDDLGDWRGETLVIRSHGVSAELECEMRRIGATILDCTCPDVKKIHHILDEARSLGRAVIILGEESHPEVMAYAREGDIVAASLGGITDRLDGEKKYTLAAQTTFDRAAFDDITETLLFMRPDVEIHQTICDSTARRQREASELAAASDVMIVLGDEASANTRRLYEICKRHCERTFLTPSVGELRLQFLRPGDKIGITAGASTPPSITKEAVRFMNDIASNVEAAEPEGAEAEVTAETEVLAAAQPAQTAPPAAKVESFEEMLNENFLSLRTGDIVKATVIAVTNSEVTVNLGYKSDGLITKLEMTDDPSAELAELAKPGDVFEVYVLRVNDSDGNVLVSKKKLDNQVNYKTIEQAFVDKTPIAGKVTEVVKGGLIALVLNCRVFIPSSQISNRYVDDLSVFKGKEFNFNILEYDRSKRRIVAGRKELATLEQQQRREELYGSLEIGQRLDGVVSRIVEFGAFIDLGGVDGLVHISELAWKRVRKVTDVLQVGDRVVVTVLEVNPEKNKISLTLKDISNNPWNDIAEKYPVGSIVTGTVARMASFGAFVTLEDGVDGLVHISQIADRHINKPEDELSVGQTIRAKVTEINQEGHKISLSKREADAELGVDEETEGDEEVASDEAAAPNEFETDAETEIETADEPKINVPEAAAPEEPKEAELAEPTLQKEAEPIETKLEVNEPEAEKPETAPVAEAKKAAKTPKAASVQEEPKTEAAAASKADETKEDAAVDKVECNADEAKEDAAVNEAEEDETAE